MLSVGTMPSKWEGMFFGLNGLHVLVILGMLAIIALVVIAIIFVAIRLSRHVRVSDAIR